jgi:hypothetical protein
LKIDLSTLLLVTLCVIPGLFAQRSRNLVCPRSFVDQGASGELGELVALGISTHGLIILMAAICLLVAGILDHLQPALFFRRFDTWDIQAWSSNHRSFAAVLATSYVFLSFAVSHWFGLVYGIWRYHAPLTTAAFTKVPWLSLRLKYLGIGGVLGERPIIYEVLSPKKDSDGVPYKVFVEVEMKNQAGIYAGQLSQFAIVKDEEPHKPVYLVDVSFRRSLDESYETIEADGVMLDLAEAAQVYVKQVPSQAQLTQDISVSTSPYPSDLDSEVSLY